MTFLKHLKRQEEIMEDIRISGATAEEIDSKIAAVLKELGEDQGDPATRALQNDIALRSYHVEGLVNEAAQCFPARKTLPDRMNRFPLKYFGFMHRFILRVYELLFREQRSVNLALIKALRESVAMNRQLNEQVVSGQQKLALALREQQEMLAALRTLLERGSTAPPQD